MTGYYSEMAGTEDVDYNEEYQHEAWLDKIDEAREAEEGPEE